MGTMSDAHSDHSDQQVPVPDGEPGSAHPHVPHHVVVIPPEVSMVSLLGPRDELLRTMERQFPRRPGSR